MDWQKGKDCEIYEKYPVENRLCVVSTGMNVIVWRKHPWQISFQRKILQKAAKDKGYTDTVFFVDDGITGTTMKRPGFQKMLTAIEAGYISAVFVKDLSRLGRNYIEVVKLTEEFFPLHDIRLVAVSDGVDSDEG